MLMAVSGRKMKFGGSGLGLESVDESGFSNVLRTCVKYYEQVCHGMVCYNLRPAQHSLFPADDLALALWFSLLCINQI